MEGGIAILLLLILVAIGAVAVFAFTGLGGALSLKRRGDAKAEGDGNRPEHTQPTTPYHEHARFTPEEHAGEDARAEAQRSRD